MENNLNTPNINTRPEPHRHAHRWRAWWPLVLILVGVILLIQNLHPANFIFNWWALFIFIPVLGSLSAAWDGLRQDGRFSARVGGSLGSAIVIGTVGTILLFGLDWNRLWPLMIIAVGLSVFCTGLGRIDKPGRNNLAALTRLSVWVGLAAIVLGLGFDRLFADPSIANLHDGTLVGDSHFDRWFWRSSGCLPDLLGELS